MDITRAATARRAASMKSANSGGNSGHRSSTLRAGTPPVEEKKVTDDDAEQTRGIFDWEQPPGDEPGTLADVMDGTAQQDPEQEENQKLY